MMKKKVVIRAHICRRDVIVAETIAHLLQRFGVEARVACSRDFETVVRMWRPDAVIVMTVGGMDKVKQCIGDALFVFLDGEGMARPEVWSERAHRLDIFDLVMLWGERAKSMYAEHNPRADLTKVRVTGNPKLDSVLFLPEQQSQNSVGIVTRFNNINNYMGKPASKSLHNRKSTDYVISQCRAFYSMIEVVRAILQKTNLNISIRPHPLEQIESYQAYKKFWFGDAAYRVSVDESINFAEWAAGQKALISPTSTSFLEAYLLKKPVINIDGIAETSDIARDHAVVSREWQAAGHSPSTISELINILSDEHLEVPSDTAIDRQLAEFCSYPDRRSASMVVVRELMHALAQRPAMPRTGLPQFVLDLVDRRAFSRLCRENALHPNMNYKRGYHDLGRSFPELIDSIVSASQQIE